MTDTLSLDHFLPYRLAVSSSLVSDVIAQAYERLFGLRIAEWRVIALLAEQEPLTQLALVKGARMDKMTVSRAVRPLVERGLIERAPNSADGRSHILRLSETGRVLHRELVPVALKLEAEILKDFGTAEVEALTASLRRLEAAARYATEADA